MSNIINRANLLIIDDDVLARRLVGESLRTAGFDLREAGDGASGIAMAGQCHPDLVLLDVMMAGMDGYDVCRALRQLPEFGHIPVIMLTGLDDAASIERAYECGATDFITKPINPTLLTHRVRYALRLSRMLTEIDGHRADLADAQRIACLGSWMWQAAGERFECSEQYQKIIGEPSLSPGYQWRDSLRYVHPDDAIRVSRATDAARDAGAAYALVYRIVRRDGVVRTVHEQTEVFRDADGRVARIKGTTQDITDRVAAEDRIRQLADYDGLTGLANRRLFTDVTQRGLTRSGQRAAHAAVLDINLDRFKRINETLGHATGDQILQEVARRIVETVRGSELPGSPQVRRQGDVSARMSGDGYAVFLPELRHAEDVALIARRVIDAVVRPMQCGGHELSLTASIGIAVYPDNGDEVGTLLRNADAALRIAKERGAGNYCFFTPQMNVQAMVNLDTENDLRIAIAHGQLTLFYQPRVDVSTGKLAGAEALLRWQHPRRGLVKPDEFIPIAEESGLISPLTTWLVHAACRQLQQWQGAGVD